MIIFIDLDGTVCNAKKRFVAAGPEPERTNKEAYLEWVSKVQSHESLLQDQPVPGMLELVAGLSRQHSIFYLTARNEEYRNTTLHWLQVHKFPTRELIMRSSDDWSSSGVFKGKAVAGILNNYTSNLKQQVLVIDDDPLGDIAAMCAAEGYLFLKVVGYGY